MIQNIILITLFILIFFFMSNEKNVNELISKKYMKYFILLIIIYFIYQNYNLVLLLIVLLVFLFFNTDFKEKLKKNKYLEKFGNLSFFKNIIKEKFSNETLDINLENINDLNESKKNEDKKIEPFRDEVIKLKDLYENIKMQIKKLG